MGRDSSPAPKRRKTYSISVCAEWADRVKHYMLRGIVLDSIFREIMKELPPDRKLYFEFRRRGIDNTIRTRYYGHQLGKPNNGTMRFIYPKDTAAVKKGKP